MTNIDSWERWVHLLYESIHQIVQDSKSFSSCGGNKFMTTISVQYRSAFQWPKWTCLETKQQKDGKQLSGTWT
jgi:hypothetical protein